MAAMISLLLLVPAWTSAAFLVAAAFVAAVAIVSFLDDVYSLPNMPRFMVHIAAATTIIYLVKLEIVDFGLPYIHFVLPEAFATVFAVLFAVAFLNFFNFMDGINGIAAFQGIAGGLTIAILLAMGAHGQPRSILLAAAVAGGCLGFLPHNFPHARVFMGDIGSATLGFGLAILTFVGAKVTDVPWVAYVMPLGVFLYDATFTVIKRAIRKEHFWKPHREHHYQLLIRAGWSHKTVTLLNAVLMMTCSIAAIGYAIVSDAGRLIILLSVFAAMVGYTVFVHRVFQRSGQTSGTDNTPEDAA
jgi:UDP-N-acetylmuramyl pentapeptide phosphotransferase/UDP-N-acetylglucosamine-1-phosphate transferase